MSIGRSGLPMLNEEKIMGDLISLKEAAKISKYAPDYLGYLIRTKKLGGVRVGRDWFTSKESLSTYLLTKKFVAVKEILPFILKPKLILAGLGIIFIVAVGAILAFGTGDFLQKKAPGDFQKTELDTKKVVVENSEGSNGAKEIKITSYTTDEAGGIEISVDQEGNK